MKFIAQVLLVLIVPTLLWVIVSYFGGMVPIGMAIARVIGLTVAAFILFFVVKTSQ